MKELFEGIKEGVTLTLLSKGETRNNWRTKIRIES